MKTTFIAVLSVLASAISAAPAGAASFPAVTVQLSNDKTGATGSATITANGVDQSVVALFGNTPVGASGHVVATSAQLSNFPQGVFCIIKQGEAAVGVLNFKKTFADLDGNPALATPVDLTGAILNCQV